MLKFLSLSSGSSGNCYLLTNGKAGLLIDAGVSLRRMKKVLCEQGFTMETPRAILVTHDHLDHIRHLGSYCKKLCLPVYATEVLHSALSTHTFTKDHIGDCSRSLDSGGPHPIPLGPDIPESDCPRVSSFVVPHDATQTVGYFIEWGGSSFFLMTDAGRVTDEALAYASKADSVVFESNYDTGMLFGGPYPHDLKMRICRGNGHLSNDECARAIGKFWHKGLRNIFLCHLSDNNNTPALAFATAAESLRRIPVGEGLTAKEVTNLQTLPRSRESVLFDIL